MDAHAQKMWQDTHTGLRAFIAKRVANEAEADDIVQEVGLSYSEGLMGCKIRVG